MRCIVRLLAVGLVTLVCPAAAHAQSAPSASSPSPVEAPAPPGSSPAPASPPEPTSSMPAPVAPPLLAANDPVDLPRGVLVTAADDASTEPAWALALVVYADPRLRPRKLDEPTARVLAGEAPTANASPRQLELSELRRSFAPGAAAAPRLLSSVAREFDVSGVLVVWREAPDQIHARLFIASRSTFALRDLRPELGPDLRTSWTSATAWLRAQANRAQPVPPARAPNPAPEPQGGSFLTSGWFWGAVVMVAGAGVFAYALSSRDGSPTTIHLQGRVAL